MFQREISASVAEVSVKDSVFGVAYVSKHFARTINWSSCVELLEDERAKTKFVIEYHDRDRRRNIKGKE